MTSHIRYFTATGSTMLEVGSTGQIQLVQVRAPHRQCMKATT